MRAALILAQAALAVAEMSFPRVCLSQPPVQLQAGQHISFEIENPFENACEAMLTFSDENFLPVTFSFEKISCSGIAQAAQFMVPPEAPNGASVLTLRCAGQSTEVCSHAVVSNGGNRSDVITNMQEGTLGCIYPVVLTSTVEHTFTNGIVETLTSYSLSDTTRFSTTSTKPVHSGAILSPSTAQGTTQGTTQLSEGSPHVATVTSTIYSNASSTASRPTATTSGAGSWLRSLKTVVVTSTVTATLTTFMTLPSPPSSSGPSRD